MALFQSVLSGSWLRRRRRWCCFFFRFFVFCLFCFCEFIGLVRAKYEDARQKRKRDKEKEREKKTKKRKLLNAACKPNCNQFSFILKLMWIYNVVHSSKQKSWDPCKWLWLFKKENVIFVSKFWSWNIPHNLQCGDNEIELIVNMVKK